MLDFCNLLFQLFFFSFALATSKFKDKFNACVGFHGFRFIC